MKVTQDLRVIIRAKARAVEAADTWDNRAARRKRAIQDFFKSHPRHHRACRAASKRLDCLRREIEKAAEVFKRVGLYSDLSGFADEEKFVEAGGVLPEASAKFDGEKLIAELAGLSAEDGLALLKTHGIDWV